MLAADSFTLVESFTLNVPLGELTPVVTGMMKRLEEEGVAGLVSMQFHASSSSGDVGSELGAIIRFSDRSRLHEHIAMVSSWPELARFSKMITLTELRVFGELDPAIESWMRQFNGPIRKHERFVAGFMRPS